MQIQVKTLTGRKQNFDFEPKQTVMDIKSALQEKEGIDVKQIKLIYMGKQLADSDTIEATKIEAGATVHMVLSLRGGAF